MRSTSMALATALGIALLVATSARAEPFTATYVFTGQPGNEASVSATNQPSGAAFSGLMRSTDLSSVSAVNSFDSSHFAQTATLTDTTKSYLTFTITPTAGEILGVSLIDFFVQRSTTGPINLDLRSSLDGYSSSLYTATIANSDTVYEEKANLSLAGITSPLTFHLYAFDSGGTAGTFRLTDASTGGTPGLSVTGSVAVPEPGSLALVGLGCLSLLGCRFRRSFTHGGVAFEGTQGFGG